MPKATGLQPTSDKEDLLRLLRKLFAAQLTRAQRKCVTNFMEKLQQEPAGSAPRRLLLPAFTAQELQKADDAEHSYRSVRRLLCAGTPFTVVSGSVKEQNVKDFAVLLGDLWDEDAFPLRGGRLFIAGVLSRILGRYVSLVDIKKGFPIQNNQKMVVSDSLSTELKNVGVTWPPNIDGFQQCPTYRRVKWSSAQTWDGTPASSGAWAGPMAGVTSSPRAVADLYPAPLFFTSDLEEASSSHNMQVDAAALQEGPASSVSADSMQHEPWAVLADPPLTFMTSALMLPSLISVDADLDAYGSGVSSGEMACIDWSVTDSNL
ncbi:hypothetical protein ABBQ38_007771 [Trebouxia sp. C0009 RCD-2024]